MARLPADVEDAYPVTLLQMGMIFHNEMAQGSGLYHDVFSNFLALPAWDQDALRLVLDALGRKHPVLRTASTCAATANRCNWCTPRRASL